jgi:Kef-type K+ transport system membrane component KefB
LNRLLTFFVSLTVSAAALLWWIFYQSNVSFVKKTNLIVAPIADSDTTSGLWATLAENLHHPVALLLLQVIVVVFFARLMGIMATRLGQPSVVGEILAGIVLGPSLIGNIFPAFTAFLFPPDSLASLQALSQFGLVLFMFIIGIELDISVLQKQASKAIIISHSSIIIAYTMGVGLAYFLYENFAPADTTFAGFALFMGIAMSIAAFPVLARIVQERGISKTLFGSMIITCAAVDDVTAWCLFAIVVATVKAGSVTDSLFTIGASVAYVTAMLFIVRPFLVKFSEIYASKENINRTVIAFIFLLLLVSALITELIGIHAFFGAFLAGAIIPHNIRFKEILTEKIEDVSLVLLLPLFFVFTGLRTEIGLLNNSSLWATCGIIIATAVFGKMAGTIIPARIVGFSWANSFTLGALMNTRGLMELVVLNVGYDLGLLSPEIFAMMVLMAVLTTMMTGPALDLIEKLSDWLRPAKTIAADSDSYHILISFGVPAMGRKLLQLAAQMGAPPYNNLKITALHITPNSQVSPIDAQIFEQEGFAPVKELASQLQIDVNCIYRTTDDLVKEVEDTVEKGNFDFLLVGSARSLFTTDRTGGVVQRFLHEIDTEIGILVDRELDKVRKMLLLLDAPGDMALLPYVQRFADGGAHHLTVLQTDQYLSDEKNLVQKNFSESFAVDILGVTSAAVDWPLKGYDLVLISRRTYEKLTEQFPEWIAKCPNILIVRSVN